VLFWITRIDRNFTQVNKREFFQGGKTLMDNGYNGYKWNPELNAVALPEAVLCADCEVISNSAGERCEICGSPSLLSLGRVLGGSIEGQRATVLQANSQSLRGGFTVLVNPAASTMLRARRRRHG